MVAENSWCPFGVVFTKSLRTSWSGLSSHDILKFSSVPDTQGRLEAANYSIWCLIFNEQMKKYQLWGQRPASFTGGDIKKVKSKTEKIKTKDKTLLAKCK